MNFSVKKLITQSAKQIVFLAQHPKPDTITDNILRGDEFQHSIAKTLPIFGEEMGGSCQFGSHTLYFTHDVVVNNSMIMEIKSVNGVAADWYFQSSVLQCAIYKVLTTLCGGFLHTAKFFEEISHEQKNIQMNQDFRYILLFGSECYQINIVNAMPIISFLEEKIQAIENGYQSAEAFDARWKHQEYNRLAHCFLVTKVFNIF